MYVIVNSHEDILCVPGSNTPYTFEEEDEAQKFLERTGIEGIIVNANSQEEERYGGQNDLW